MGKRRTRFRTWAKKDIEDTRRIHYTVYYDNIKETFTSDDCKPASFCSRLGYMWIKSLELKSGEWYVELYED